MVSQCTKYEVSRFTRYEAVNGGAKWGGFGVVRGHSGSTAISPFDRAYTTSYSTLIGSMCLSCGVVCVIVCLAVLVELRLVTDRQTDTDRHRPMASTADA